MAGQKKSVPAPIDKPLQKAYLRQFTGWSTAYPPGNSDPTSCRVMENVMIRRNGSISVRPGLRYVSYKQTPDMDALTNGVPGVAHDEPFVGSFEPFYLNDPAGTRALLTAVRNKTTGEVEFRAVVFTNPKKMVFRLTDPEIGFYIPQGESTLNFDSSTRYVSYLQIDNRILALSDSGQSSMRLFTVGAEKTAKKLNSITTPEWTDAHKPQLMHPLAQWILDLKYTARRNELKNPTFDAGTLHWNKGANNEWTTTAGLGRAGGTALEVWTEPQRTNLATSPLHNVSATGISGWHPGKADPKLDADGDWLKLTDAKGKNVFLAHSAKLPGIREGKRYWFAFNFELSEDAVLRARLQFYRNNGSEIGDPIKFFPTQKSGRWESPAIEAPNNAVSARLYLGADSTEKTLSWAKFKHVVLCRANEYTGMFSGDSGAGYYWEDPARPNESKSLEWLPTDVSITSEIVPVQPNKPVAGSIHVRTVTGGDRAVKFYTSAYDLNTVRVGLPVEGTGSTGAPPAAGQPVNWGDPAARIKALNPGGAGTVKAAMQITIKDVSKGDRIAIDAGMLESNANSMGVYFDGSTPSTTATVNSWEAAPHQSPSLSVTTVDLDAVPPPEPNENATTLISPTAAENKYKMGFFYTFENEIGESAPSKISEIRIRRPQSNWQWLTPDGSDPNNIKPDPTFPTDVADMCADQLLAWLPQQVYDNALASGAVRWHLYTFSWSDQDPVPVEATLAGTRELYPDRASRLSGNALPYMKGCWINVTPSRKFTVDSMGLPSATNRVNYSKPPKARSGIVAGDRVIITGDAEEPGTIRWTTSRPGDYTKFTAHKGGGVKTLSAGNLHVPCAVVLWQNPQSVDTITVLCLGSDGTSICYYMTPAEVTTQTSMTQVMGFEETTNTPGTTSPYGAIVSNNALFRPIDYALLKSTAQNYNINHKTLTDDIANMWADLQFKNWIVGAEHDNRLYFLVNNPRGAALEEGCLGNEIWVHDTAGGEQGTWSRLLIQAASLRILEYGAMVYLGVVRPDGMYYLDSNARQDDYVLEDGTVGQRPIPWFFEMNTQGSNRARDAWAHLQQVSVKFGDFEGAVRYGIRGRTVHGKTFESYKIFEDYTVDKDEGLRWDIEDHLLIRRDLKEWYFSAGSVEGKPSSGSITFVQYRFTPTTVNVGYEYGSVETFEYTRDTVEGGSSYSQGGIPAPVQDRDWQRT